MTPTPKSHPANRLAAENSPYLLQHAHNPVRWWPWGSEAIEEARRRDVPIFLSIGYSTCYWCHVMERESFEDATIGELLDQLYVSIKVDREQRPDVDDVYMAAVQMLTGSGGWPLSVFIEPASLKPFWGGTYFPPVPAFQRPSFEQVLRRLADAWANRRDEVLRQATVVADAVREKLGAGQPPVQVGAHQISQAVGTLLTIFDRTHGGFGGSPKFPQPVYLELLMAARARVDSATRSAIDLAVRSTLDRMAAGGLFDQVGGGFHRYSVDATWTVPHFEKMLYDNAQLLAVYAEAASVYGDGFYRRIADRTVGYLLREMAAPRLSGFYTAQDAEVAGREGLNYLWTARQIRQALPPELGDLAVRVYGLDRGPNFQDPHHPSEPTGNVLRLDARPELVATALGVPHDELLTRLDDINSLLLQARGQRPQPRLDDKLLLGWNGQMIGALARASAALNEPDWLVKAAEVARSLLASMRGPDGFGMMRSMREEHASVGAVLEDYALLAYGLLEVERAMRAMPAAAVRKDWSADGPLGEAERLVAEAQRLFGSDDGGFYDTRADAADLFVRSRHTYDGAMPSAGSVMLNCLVTLAELTGDGRYRAAAIACVASLGAAIAESPVATANSTLGLLRILGVDPEGLKSHLRACGAAEPDDLVGVDQPRAGAAPVEIFVSADTVQVSPETPGEVFVQLRIADGYHINSAYAGEQSGGVVVPLQVAIAGRTAAGVKGVRVYADSPAGEVLPGASHTVLSGVVEVRVAIECDPDRAGEPKLVLTFQACTDRECMAPEKIDLGVGIELV